MVVSGTGIGAAKAVSFQRPILNSGATNGRATSPAINGIAANYGRPDGRFSSSGNAGQRTSNTGCCQSCRSFWSRKQTLSPSISGRTRPDSASDPHAHAGHALLSDLDRSLCTSQSRSYLPFRHRVIVIISTALFHGEASRCKSNRCCSGVPDRRS